MYRGCLFETASVLFVIEIITVGISLNFSNFVRSYGRNIYYKLL
jgi:hypothetical protein